MWTGRRPGDCPGCRWRWGCPPSLGCCPCSTTGRRRLQTEGIHGKDTTPFLLAHIKDYTKGVSLASNLQLAYTALCHHLPDKSPVDGQATVQGVAGAGDARMAAKIAIAYSKLG
mgnify:CR=1 FL=1